MLLLALLLLAAGDAEPENPPVGAVPCVGCRAPAGEIVGGYSAGDWEALRSGDILILEESRERDESRLAGAARAAGLIAHPPELVWSVLTDFEAWPGFVPLVTGMEVVQREGRRQWVRVRYKVLFVGMQHTTIYELAPAEGELRWSLDAERPHDIAATQGLWQLVPISDGSATLLRYRARMDAGRGVPDFVEDMLARRSLRGLIASVRAEVDRRFAPDAGESAR